MFCYVKMCYYVLHATMFLYVRLCLTMSWYLRPCVTVCCFVWVSVTIYEGVLLCVMKCCYVWSAICKNVLLCSAMWRCVAMCCLRLCVCMCDYVFLCATMPYYELICLTMSTVRWVRTFILSSWCYIKKNVKGYYKVIKETKWWAKSWNRMYKKRL
jgi:hypothetical protein